MRASRPLALLAVASATATGPLLGATAHASNVAGPSVLSRPAFTTNAVDLGALSSSSVLHMRLWIGMRDAATASSIGTAVSTPDSSSYRHYLTRDEFAARFAPTAAEVSDVESWARSNGLAVGAVGPDRFYIELTAPTLTAERAFSVALHRYSYKGHSLYAPTTAVSIPAALRGEVVAIDGLDNHQLLYHPDNDFGAARPVTKHADAAPAAVFNNAAPCSQYYNSTPSTFPQAYGTTPAMVLCGNHPATLQAAYGLTNAIASGNNGSGQTVAIVDAYDSPTIIDDVNTWSSRWGLPQLAGTQCAPQATPEASNCVSTQYVDVTPQSQAYQDDPTGFVGLPDASGWAGEQTLDTEAIHSMAPGATIYYFGANTEFDLDTTLLRAVATPGVDEVNNSWGGSGDASTDGVEEYTVIGTMAEDLGVGIYFSSGDSGDESGGTGQNPTVDFPASDPLVTAVGGTTIATNPDGTRGLDTAWGIALDPLSDDGTSWAQPLPGTYQSGGGGGISTTFAQPAYQNGVVNAFSTTQRVEPDIAADGDAQTGLYIGLTQTQTDGTTSYSEYRLGGTSLSSPLIAGVMALVSQRAGANVGFANPALYALDKINPAAFYDVSGLPGPAAVARNDFNNSQDGPTHTTLRTFQQLASLKVNPGYDDSTGLGEPNGTAFLAGLATNPGLLPGLPGQPSPSVPEAPAVALLALAGMGAAAVAVMLRRRRT